MKKIFIFAVIFILLSSPVTAKKPSKIKYAALGDSIAAGHSLPDYTESGGSANSYVSVVLNSIRELYAGYDVEFSSLAVNGITTDRLCEKIKSSPEIVRDADIITVSVGSNDLLSIFERVIDKYLGDTDISMLAENRDFEGLKSVYEKMELAKAELTNSGELEDACSAFPEKLNNLISLLSSAAPKADIYFTNVYNPFDRVNIPGINLFEFAEPYIQKFNSAFLKNGSCKIVDIYSAFLNSKENVVCVQDNISSFDPHPNVNGHRIIAEEIIKNIAHGKDESVKNSGICLPFKSNVLFYKDIAAFADNKNVFFKNFIKNPGEITLKFINSALKVVEIFKII